MTLTLNAPEIYDFDVWVTPLTRYLAIDSLNTISMKLEYPEADFTQAPDPNGYVPTPTYIFELTIKGSLIISQLEKLGHRVRLKEIATPRFGEDFWMKTNRITQGE
jgi:hypothetical protein